MELDATETDTKQPLVVLVLADNVRAKRAEHGWTQEHLARRMTGATGRPYTRAIVNATETMARRVRLEDLPPLCEALEISLPTLLMANHFRLRWGPAEVSEYSRLFRKMFHPGVPPKPAEPQAVPPDVSKTVEELLRSWASEREDAYRKGVQDGIRLFAEMDR